MIVSGINVEGSLTATTTEDITIFAGSDAKDLIVKDGDMQVSLAPGSFIKVGSAVQSHIASMIYNDGTSEYCVNNSNPGTTKLEILSNEYATYDLRFSVNICGQAAVEPATVTFVETHSTSTNATTTVITQGNTEVQKVETTASSSDGTLAYNSLTTTKVDDVVTEIAVKNIVDVADAPTDTQTINLESSDNSSVGELNIDISPNIIQDIISSYGSTTDLIVDVVHKTASSSQIQENKLIIDGKVFTIDISAGSESVTTFDTPLVLTFDITNVTDRDNLSIAWFNASTNEWTNLASTISGNTITATVDHLTDFSIISYHEISPTTPSTSSGGGGGSSYYNTSATHPTKQMHKITNDGTEVDLEIMDARDTIGFITERTHKTVLTLSDNIQDSHIIEMNTSDLSHIAGFKLGIDKEILQKLGTSSQEQRKKVEVKIVNKKPSNWQRDSRLLSYNFEVFGINIFTDNEEITQFSKPLSLSFDLSKVMVNKNDLKVYYFNKLTNSWKLAGNGGILIGNQLSVDIYHLTDFALLKFRDTPVKQDKPVPVVVKTTSREQQLAQILADANAVYDSGSNLDNFIRYNRATKNVDAQRQGMEKYAWPLVGDDSGLSINQIYAINNFAVYGTPSTRKLGAGERAGVVNSYKKAFGKFPISSSQWRDVVAIANGRWPNVTSPSAEKIAQESFKKVYKRSANMNNQNDNAAVTIMAYGLRPTDRNLNSEKVAIKTFKYIYWKNPKSALDWDIVRAIAYSGATREVAGIQKTTSVCSREYKLSEDLEKGSYSEEVIELQKILKCLDYFPKELSFTTFFGNATKKAVQDFQVDNNIVKTGVVGVATRAVLNR